MKFLAVEHHRRVHPRIVVSKIRYKRAGKIYLSPQKGIGLVSLLFGKVHSLILIKLRFEGTRLLYFFNFSNFTVSRIFSYFTTFTPTHFYPDRTSLQVYIYLASVLFLLQVQRKHKQPDNQSRCRVYTQRYDSTTERLWILLTLWLAHLHTRPEWFRHFANLQWIVKW